MTLPRKPESIEELEKKATQDIEIDGYNLETVPTGQYVKVPKTVSYERWYTNNPKHYHGAFHSYKLGGQYGKTAYMEPAKMELEKAIDQAEFRSPICPVYQNVTGKPSVDPFIIRENLKKQLTSPVKWTQTMKSMLADGADTFFEAGPGSVLQGLIKKIDRNIITESARLF